MGTESLSGGNRPSAEKVPAKYSLLHARSVPSKGGDTEFAYMPAAYDALDDVVIIIKRALLAWLLGDGDMHLKNLALLKIAEPGDTQFRSVRMAPLYDAVTTRVFPRLEHDRMALKLNGKDNRLRRADFRAAGATAGAKASDVDAAIDEMVARVREAVGHIALPDLRDHRADAAAMIEKVTAVVRAQLEGL